MSYANVRSKPIPSRQVLVRNQREATWRKRGNAVGIRNDDIVVVVKCRTVKLTNHSRLLSTITI
jgi:hypothetical protein